MEHRLVFGSIATVGLTAFVLAPAAGSSAQATAVAAPVAVAAAASPHPRIAWAPCAQAPKVQCGTLSVPVDWASGHGPTIQVAVARRPADDPRHRVGTLFFNPGGPSDGAAAYVLQAERVFSPTLRARFDIVGMDPRATGDSTRVQCTIPVITATTVLFPRSEQQFDELRRHNRAVGLDCLKHTGALMAHTDTISVARDHEALRRALGVETVNWLGLSYGVQVAANYAQLFPTRTRAMALDAALEHSLPESEQVRAEAMSAEDSFNRFVRWCRTATGCALRGRDVAALFDRLVRDADRHPIPVAGSIRPVTGEDIRMATVGKLRFKEPSIFGPGISWPGLSQALRKALAGDAVEFAVGPAGVVQDGAFSLVSIACMEYVSQIHSYADLRRRMQLARKWAPHLQGASETWQVNRCIDWPIPAANPPRRLDVRGVPTLIVNARHDPSIPFSWAEGMAAQIRGSILLARTGDGHTSYYNAPCARAAIDTYLIKPARPATRVCRE